MRGAAGLSQSGWLACLALALVSGVVKAQQCDADFDLVFVVDGSGSIRDSNPPGVVEGSEEDNWTQVKRFLLRIVHFLEVTESPSFGVRVGVVTFGNRGKVELELSGNLSLVQDTLANLPYQGGTTNTSGGLYQAGVSVLGDDATNRQDIDDVIFVITDGDATVDVNLTQPYAQELQNANVRMFAVGITSGINVDNVKELTSPNDDGERVEGEVYWLLSDFSAINEVVDSIANEVCNILSDLCASDPCVQGTCHQIFNAYMCNCSRGYHGYNCQLDYCDPNPCENGGVCSRQHGGFTCDCAAPFFGPTCLLTPSTPSSTAEPTTTTTSTTTISTTPTSTPTAPTPSTPTSLDTTTEVTPQPAPQQSASKTVTTTEDNWYLVALIIILLLGIVALVTFLVLCCCWARIKAHCCPKDSYVAPEKIVIKEEQEVISRTAQCDLRQVPAPIVHHHVTHKEERKPPEPEVEPEPVPEPEEVPVYVQSHCHVCDPVYPPYYVTNTCPGCSYPNGLASSSVVSMTSTRGVHLQDTELPPRRSKKSRSRRMRSKRPTSGFTSTDSREQLVTNTSFTEYASEETRPPRSRPRPRQPATLHRVSAGK